MKSKDILYSKGRNDECYTPAYAVKPILKYIEKDWVVWCPFDTVQSEFVKQIGKTNRVISSHIAEGKDFFEYQPAEEWDCIISNPPFTNKRGVFERALSFGKPMCLLMSSTWLNDKYSKWVFYEANRQMELLMFDKRIHFIQEDDMCGRPTFSSSYFCSDFLPKQIVIEKLNI